MSDVRRYYASRGGAVAGPHTVQEIRDLLNKQELALDDVVCVEGSQEWLPLRGVREIVPNDPGPASKPSQRPAAKAAQAADKASAATAKPKPRSDYVPGGAPTLPGIYLPFAATPDELLLQLDAIEHPKAPPPGPGPELPRTRLALSVLLLGLSAAASAVDARLAYPHGVFSMLTPFAWLGLILVWLATRPPAPRPSWFKTGLGCGGLLLVPIMFLGGAMFVSPDSSAYSLFTWTLGSAVALLVAFLVSASGGPPKAPPLAAVLPKLQMTKQVLEALRDDVAPGKRVSGWLDLTGPDQQSKVVRSAKAANGAKVDLLRDEWWRLRVPLRDGNELRVSAVERMKARRSFYKRNARGKSKLKSGRSQSLRTLEVRLAVNSAVYRLEPPREAVKIGGLSVPQATVADGAVSVVVHADAPEAREVLGVLASLYRQLAPVSEAAGGR